jgi:hypothetical protein
MIVVTAQILYDKGHFLLELVDLPPNLPLVFIAEYEAQVHIDSTQLDIQRSVIN